MLQENVSVWLAVYKHPRLDVARYAISTLYLLCFWRIQCVYSNVAIQACHEEKMPVFQPRS